MINFSKIMDKKSELKSIGYLNRKGMNDGNAGRFEDAKQKLRTALEKTRANSLSHLEAKILNNIGLIYAMEGDWSQALFHYNDAMAMLEYLSITDTTLCKTIQKNTTQLFQ